MPIRRTSLFNPEMPTLRSSPMHHRLIKTALCFAFPLSLTAIAVPAALGAAVASPSQAPKVTAKLWTTTSAGTSHTCGITTKKQLWCWGYNDEGELGLGNQIATNAPKRVGTAADWLTVAAGGDHTCGIRKDHSLWCWGDNASGELGVGDTVNRSVPTKVGSGLDWSALALGALHT